MSQVIYEYAIYLKSDGGVEVLLNDKGAEGWRLHTLVPALNGWWTVVLEREGRVGYGE